MQLLKPRGAYDSFEAVYLKYRPRFRTTVVKYQYAYEYVTQFKPVRSNTDRTVAHRPPKTAPSLFDADSRPPAPSGLRTELRHLRAPDGLTETGTGRDTRTSLSAGTAPVWQLTPRQGHRARSESQICTVRGLAPRGPDRSALNCASYSCAPAPLCSGPTALLAAIRTARPRHRWGSTSPTHLRLSG